MDEKGEFDKVISLEEGTPPHYSLLSRNAILRHLRMGNIIIYPFASEMIRTNSVDVTLGEYYYREQESKGHAVMNPWDEQHVRRTWRLEHAKPVRITEKEFQITLGNGVSPDDKVILLAPGETVLAHTQEFIGGTNGCITTMLKARSSMGRNFIAVCKCAGMGDVGYINRWTMEITNHSKHYYIPLVVGRRIAQIIFFEVEKVDDDYTNTGKYQSSNNIKELVQGWTPESMLPKMWKDHEVTQNPAVRRELR
jgi:dCTP deaminase